MDRSPPPLVPFKGDKLPGPDWFEALCSMAVETGHTEHKGAKLIWKAWGNTADPGVILVHGGTAHKGWWDGIGPAIAQQGYRVVAPDLAGMGESGWRDTYTMDDHAEDVRQAAMAGGAFTAGQPVLIGHSFGGFVTLKASLQYGDQLKGAVLLDSPIRKPDEQRSSPPQQRGGKVYPDLATALGRFRLLPPQDVEALWLVDHIARGSLKQVEGGYAWRFDPGIWSKLQYEKRDPEYAAAHAKCPLAFFRGAQSVLMPADIWSYMRETFNDSPFITIEDAQHHLILDQPQTVTRALTGLLQTWEHGFSA